MKVAVSIFLSIICLANCSMEFLRCTEYVRKSSERSIPEADKLKAYGLFKQGTVGNCDPVLPQNSDIYMRVKHRAWCAESGKPIQVAQSEYIALIDRLAPEWRKTFEN